MSGTQEHMKFLSQKPTVTHGAHYYARDIIFNLDRDLYGKINPLNSSLVKRAFLQRCYEIIDQVEGTFSDRARLFKYAASLKVSKYKAFGFPSDSTKTANELMFCSRQYLKFPDLILGMSDSGKPPTTSEMLLEINRLESQRTSYTHPSNTAGSEGAHIGAGRELASTVMPTTGPASEAVSAYSEFLTASEAEMEALFDRISFGTDFLTDLPEDLQQKIHFDAHLHLDAVLNNGRDIRSNPVNAEMQGFDLLGCMGGAFFFDATDHERFISMMEGLKASAEEGEALQLNLPGMEAFSPLGHFARLSYADKIQLFIKHHTLINHYKDSRPSDDEHTKMTALIDWHQNHLHELNRGSEGASTSAAASSSSASGITAGAGAGAGQSGVGVASSVPSDRYSISPEELESVERAVVVTNKNLMEMSTCTSITALKRNFVEGCVSLGYAFKTDYRQKAAFFRFAATLPISKDESTLNDKDHYDAVADLTALADQCDGLASRSERVAGEGSATGAAATTMRDLAADRSSSKAPSAASTPSR